MIRKIKAEDKTDVLNISSKILSGKLLVFITEFV